MNEQLLTTARKNQGASYGLTFVAGLPLPSKIFNQIQDMQQQLEDAAPNCFTWYQPDHSHITLYAPLRSRKRAYPPLTKHELPPDLDNFVAAISTCLKAVSPFTIEFLEVKLTPIGHVVIGVEGVTAVKSKLIDASSPFLGTDAPKSDPNRVHGTIGYLHTLPTAANIINLQDTLAQINQACINRMFVEQVWLVHYAHRTLNHIIGKIPFILGKPNLISTHQFLQELHIENALKQSDT